MTEKLKEILSQKDSSYERNYEKYWSELNHENE